MVNLIRNAAHLSDQGNVARVVDGLKVHNRCNGSGVGCDDPIVLTAAVGVCLSFGPSGTAVVRIKTIERAAARVSNKQQQPG